MDISSCVRSVIFVGRLEEDNPVAGQDMAAATAVGAGRSLAVAGQGRAAKVTGRGRVVVEEAGHHILAGADRNLAGVDHNLAAVVRTLAGAVRNLAEVVHILVGAVRNLVDHTQVMAVRNLARVNRIEAHQSRRILEAVRFTR